MSKKLLDVFQIRLLFDEVCGKGMSQRVGRDVFGAAYLAHIVLYDQPQPLPREPPSPVVQEQGEFLRIPQQLHAPPVEIVLQRREGSFVDGHKPFGLVLGTYDAQRRRSEIDIIDIERYQLCHPKARGVQDF